MPPRTQSLRSLPSIDALLQHSALASANAELPRPVVLEAVRGVVAEERERLGGAKSAAQSSIDDLAARAAARARAQSQPLLRRVLNATGIVLHTNLGRAPLSLPAQKAVADIARGYSTLEYDLDRGKRGERGLGVEAWLKRLTGAEAAIVVNNGAAALLLVLSAIAAGKKVVVSRGELVEIGGSFRIPDIMEKSGAKLIEVGTTNRTKAADYERALEKHDDVAAILRVHPSNFRIAGFTARPTAQELAKLARKHRVPLIEDLGSGLLLPLPGLDSLEPEPTVRESLTAGCDLVTFSGDKLWEPHKQGSFWAQTLGRSRTSRPPGACPAGRQADAGGTRGDASGLQRRGSRPEGSPCGGDASGGSRAPGRTRATARGSDRSRLPGVRTKVEEADGEVGGGAMPLERLPGFVVSIEWPKRSAAQVEVLARSADPPVIGYIRGGRWKLDVRTLNDEEVDEAASALAKVFERESLAAST